MSSGSLTAALAAAIFMLPIGLASAAEPSTHPADSTQIAPPMGLIEFCARAPDTCLGADADPAHMFDVLDRSRRAAWARILSGKAQASGPASLRRVAGPRAVPHVRTDGRFLGGLSPQRFSPVDQARIAAINTEVNRAVWPATDVRLYGRPDFWTMPPRQGDGRLAGDCEDIVLAKRAALIRAGVNADRLSIALARTPAGEDHAVLLVAQPDGDYVLDNLDGRVLHWSDADLDWQSRHRPGELLTWIALNGV